MQAGANGSASEAPDSRWMTYTELAEARRITMSSAIKLVHRRGWRRQKDNHGTMRALVPPEWSEPARGRTFDPGAHVHHAIEALEQSIAALRERAEAAEQAARVEREQASRAIEARDAERNRANTLRDRIDTLRRALEEAEVQAEQARQEAWIAVRRAEEAGQAEARWRKLGLIGRLRHAWFGIIPDGE